MNSRQTSIEETRSSSSSLRRLHRRDLIKFASGAVLAGAVGKPLAAAVTKLESLPPGIKTSLQISTNAADEDLQFATTVGAIGHKKKQLS